jgi:hypothetical protein
MCPSLMCPYVYYSIMRESKDKKHLRYENGYLSREVWDKENKAGLPRKEQLFFNYIPAFHPPSQSVAFRHHTREQITTSEIFLMFQI